jgi:hypothetical protein
VDARRVKTVEDWCELVEADLQEGVVLTRLIAATEEEYALRLLIA